MPDIPQAEPQVAPQVQPPTEMPLAVTPAAYGAGVGEAVGTMSEVAHKVWYDAKTRADQAAVLDADNTDNGAKEAILRDPKTGVLNQFTGKDAPAATAQALQAYDDQVAKTMDGLTNDQQKLSYQRIAQARRFDLQRTLDQYEHQQGEQYQQDVHTKAIAGTVNDAVNNAHDPEALANALAQQKALIADYGKGRMSQEAIDLQTQQHASATVLASIEHLSATGDDPGAKARYDEHKADLVGRDAIVAGNMVKAGSFAGKAQRVTDAIVLDKDGNVDTRDRIDERIRALNDPLLRDEVQRRADQRLEQNQREHLDDQKQTINDVLKTAQSSPQGINDPAAVTGLAKLDPEYADQVRARFAKDGAIHSDPVAVNSLLVQAAREPQEFLKAIDGDPALALRFAKPDLETLLSKAQEIKGKGSIADAPGILSREQVLSDALVSAGYFKTNKDSGTVTPDTYAPGAIAMRAMLNQQVAAEEQATGKKVTPKRLQEMADDLAIRDAVKAGKVAGPVSAFTPAQRATATVDLGAMAKTDPGRVAQVRENIRAKADAMGVDTSRLTDDQYGRAFAQAAIYRQLTKAGDVSGAQLALDRFNAILKERGLAGSKPPADLDQQSFSYWYGAGNGAGMTP